MIRRMLITICLLIPVTGSGVVAEELMTTRPAVETLEYYFDLMLSGNLESAVGLWDAGAVERSSRFGITYTGVPNKVDVGSPVVYNFDKMRDYLFPAASKVQIIENNEFVRLEFKKVVDAKAVVHDYYAFYDGEYFWLAYPQDYYARDWPVLETKYFRIHYLPLLEGYLHPVALEGADRFVERLADSLDLSSGKLDEIEEKKIEYFFCDTDSTVEVFTGHSTKGMTDLASNDIITAHFPHNHEVAHLLVNIKLRELPLYTQPVLREGLAVHYGGRWGKAPTALLGIGAFMHNEDIVTVDSIITKARFEEQAGADMSYPVAGLFVLFLLDRMGQDKFFDLYLSLSGDINEINGMSAPEVKRTIFEAVGAESWDVLTAEFDAFAQKAQSESAVFAPGHTKQERVVFQNGDVTVAIFERWVSLSFANGETVPPTGNLLFGYDERLKGQRSILFEEQYKGAMEFPGYRWGIRYDGNEAGLYDYGTNQLVGKYIFGITPSEEYLAKDGRVIQLRYLVDLSEGAMPEKEGHKLLAE